MKSKGIDFIESNSVVKTIEQMSLDNKIKPIYYN